MFLFCVLFGLFIAFFFVPCILWFVPCYLWFVPCKFFFFGGCILYFVRHVFEYKKFKSYGQISMKYSESVGNGIKTKDNLNLAFLLLHP